ncbi:hypothetical protein Tco_1539754 [Tanacetum coccineum]
MEIEYDDIDLTCYDVCLTCKKKAAIDVAIAPSTLVIYDVLDFLNGEYENDRDDIDEGEDHYSSDDQDDLDIVDFHNEGDHEETPTNTEEVLDDPKSDFIDPEYKVKK